MRILFVAAHFPPDLSALANRVFHFARAWVDRGHEVHVLCGRPSHPTGNVPPEYRRRLYVREVVDGVIVHRVWLYATPNAGKLRRSLGYLSQACSSVALGRRIPRPDVVISTSPQVLSAVAGAVIARYKRVPLIVEIRDLWPRSIWELGAFPRHHPVIHGLERVERWLYRSAKRIVVVTHSFRDDIAGRVPSIERDDIPVITNGVELARFDPHADGAAVRAELGLAPDRTIAMYAGTHGMAHGLDVVIAAARRLPDVQFALVGEGAQKAALQRLGADVPNVLFLPGQPRERMPELYAMADISLVTLRDLPVFRTVIPSKIFEIWGMGRPLVLGVAGEAASIVEAGGGGLVVPPGDVDALAAAVRTLHLDPELRRSMGEAGRRYVEQHYDSTKLADAYLDTIAEAAGAGMPSPRRPMRWPESARSSGSSPRPPPPA